MRSSKTTGVRLDREEVKSAKDAFLDTWLPRLTADTAPISPYRVIWDLVQNLDRKNVIITHDSGNPRDQTLPFFEVVAPRGYLGWGKSTQLGTGYGMALGAKLAFPEKTCINIMGDLAFGTPGYVHLLAEGLKIAFADRRRYMADPDRVDVPVAQLISREYAERVTLEGKQMRRDIGWRELERNAGAA